MSNEFPGVEAKLLTTEFRIYVSLEEYLMWNLVRLKNC